MEGLHDFFDFAFNRRALLAAGLIGLVNGAFGATVVLRRSALFAGAISHTLFPGIALGALVFGLSPWSALLGAFVTALLAALAAQAVSRNIRVDSDTAMAIFWTGAFGGGLLILKHLSINLEIEDYLFGNILNVTPNDLRFCYFAGGLTLLVLALAWRPLVLLLFSPTLAASHGIPIRRFDYLLSALLVLVMVTSLQAVGTILALGLLVGPGAILYLFVDRPLRMVWCSGLLGSGVAMAAVFLSNVVSAGTGSLTVLLLTGLFLIALIASPKYGLAFRRVQAEASRHRTER